MLRTLPPLRRTLSPVANIDGEEIGEAEMKPGAVAMLGTTFMNSHRSGYGILCGRYEFPQLGGI
jgi:hypothetical protein